jgi:hypothetical protein
MSIESALARGRAAAEALQVDTCVIKRKTGETTGAGGVITPAWTTLYTGQKCRVQSIALADQGTTVGEAYRIVKRPEVQLPIAVTGLLEGDVITITASVLDPDLVGRVYTVRDVLTKSQATARRVTVLELTS